MTQTLSGYIACVILCLIIAALTVAITRGLREALASYWYHKVMAFGAIASFFGALGAFGFDALNGYVSRVCWGTFYGGACTFFVTALVLAALDTIRSRRLARQYAKGWGTVEA